MGLSIQEYCKKINRELTFVDIGSIFLTLIFLALLVIVINTKRGATISPVIYKEADRVDSQELSQNGDTGKPFASKSGKTYTFEWCQGSSRISSKNKIYFSSLAEAEASGRTLSKLCKK